ncbi:MAG: iron chelate uptake ABC transporter family permease subunit [Desulfomonilaceae bacterium]|nr:iron chelate uptake ABC transporter family permease subunit [Desulfomonilaceae bacterium]
MFEQIFHAFADPLGQTFFQKALLGGSVAAIVCSVVGCLVILRRMAFLGDALSHAMIAGVAGGYLFMKLLFAVEAHAPSMLIGSLIAAVVTVASIGFVSRVSRIKDDTAIGIMYTGVFAAGVVLVSIFRNYVHIDLVHFIMGDVLGVADSDLWVAAIAAALVLSVVVLFYRYFQLTSFDPIMAASLGMPVVLIDYALTTCVSLVVVSAVSMVGVILVVGLLITPAATAYLLCDRLDRMMILAAVFGVTSVTGGLYLCMWLDSSGGGAVMLFCTFQFLVVLVAAPRYGMLANWIRRTRMVPQQLMEDVLATVMRGGGSPVSMAAISDYLKESRDGVAGALRSMVREGLLSKNRDGVTLTEAGEREARRILRAHRLWETYLKHVGMPVADLHRRAHVLEHVHDPESVAYLDDLLGHPEHDPHGSEIPPTVNACFAGGMCTISELREGMTVRIESVGPTAERLGIEAGESVRVGPRSLGGTAWCLVRQDGTEVLLDHEAADDVKATIV